MTALYGWPWSLFGKRVVSLATHRRSTVTDIISLKGARLIEIQSDTAPSPSVIPIERFRKDYGLLHELPANVVRLDAYRVRRGNYPMNPLGAA